MRIAVIGAGIAGLTAASVLQRRHHVTVFEANHYVGGHTNTIPVREGGRTVPVDTGFIVFNEPSYPNLCKLFELHDVAAQDSDMSFSVHTEDRGFEYNGGSFDALFSQRGNLLNPVFWGMLGEILRFHREAPRDLRRMDDTVTVEDYVRDHGYRKTFVERYLVPLGASLWSCDAVRFRHFPMRFVLEFLSNHHMLQVRGRPTWKTVRGGSCRYVPKLTAGFSDRIRLSSPVTRVRRGARSIHVTPLDGAEEAFDEVVLASHADQSLAILDRAEDEETELLGAFPYQENEAVLHTDTRLLPSRERAWASWNYRIPTEPDHRVSVTYNLNRLQSLACENTYCVSLNQSARIDPRKVIRRIGYMHPLATTGRGAAQRSRAALVRRRGISYCGAYWGYGFHEDGVRSALDVCEAFDMGLDS